MRLIELGGKLFNPDAIDAAVPIQEKTFISLRSGASFTVRMPYEDVRDRLLTDRPSGDYDRDPNSQGGSDAT